MDAAFVSVPEASEGKKMQTIIVNRRVLFGRWVRTFGKRSLLFEVKNGTT